MVGDFDRLYDEGESVVLDLSTVHTYGPPSLSGKDKRDCVTLTSSVFSSSPGKYTPLPPENSSIFPDWESG